MPRRFAPRLLLLLFVVIVLVAGFAQWVRSSVKSPIEHSEADRIVTIEPGMGTQAIISRLAEAGLIKQPTALRIYLKLAGSGGGLKAGDYRFASPISPLQIIEKIRRGEVVLERVTVPEGFNRFEIAELLASKTGKASEAEFLKLTEDQTAISQIVPEVRDLEGFMFPDTYNYSARTTAEELVRSMVSRFDEVFGPEWTNRASQLGLTINQAVTLASMVEKEAKLPEERPVIASVFYNRLKIGMPLASDPTFIYAAILAGDYDGNPNQPRHRRRESRYNTYIFAGLPPAPICSPGRASLEAALYPAETDYLYFVVNGTAGRHKFSRTSAEHDIAVAEYRRQQSSGKR